MMRGLVNVAVITVLAGCVQPTELSPIPRIVDVAVSNRHVQEGVDQVFVVISFEDGDGDLGLPSGDPNAWIRDSRLPPGIPGTSYAIPPLNSGGEMPIVGEIEFDVTALATCINQQQHSDTLVFEVYLRDGAGHESNHAFTEEVIVECK
jgi:hypothetical protein